MKITLKLSSPLLPPPWLKYAVDQQQNARQMDQQGVGDNDRQNGVLNGQQNNRRNDRFKNRTIGQEFEQVSELQTFFASQFVKKLVRFICNYKLFHIL